MSATPHAVRTVGADHQPMRTTIAPSKGIGRDDHHMGSDPSPAAQREKVVRLPADGATSGVRASGQRRRRNQTPAATSPAPTPANTPKGSVDVEAIPVRGSEFGACAAGDGDGPGLGA